MTDRTIILIRALLTFAAAFMFAPVVWPQVTSTRVTTYDWQCQNEQGARISDHQREGSAITACANLSLADGKTRFVQGGRYRITGKVAAPPPPPPPPPPPVTGSVTLDWTAPTKNHDGTALTNLAGYRVRYGNSPTALTQMLQVPGAGAVSAVVPGLASGTWYFSVSAYDAGGVESSPSNPVSRTLP